jgi:hypothetical protein
MGSAGGPAPWRGAGHCRLTGRLGPRLGKSGQPEPKWPIEEVSELSVPGFGMTFTRSPAAPQPKSPNAAAYYLVLGIGLMRTYRIGMPLASQS